MPMFFALNLWVMMGLILVGCTNAPDELLAPCSWEHRSNCGKSMVISHQDQL